MERSPNGDGRAGAVGATRREQHGMSDFDPGLRRVALLRVSHRAGLPALLPVARRDAAASPPRVSVGRRHHPAAHRGGSPGNRPAGPGGAVNTAAKIRSATDAARWRESQRAPVVFTNGVFDLLHAGHVHLLEAARAEGGTLIVGVNSDASVRRLGKGEHRPVVAEPDRARLLAALAAVDCVVVFDEDTPLELIRRLRPDVLVKGADYARDDIVGADETEGWGGRVVRVPLVKGKSTTDLLRKLHDSQ